MIKLTDENRSDYIASCLMEAAEIMSEGGLVFKGGELVSKLNQGKLNNLPPEEREKAKDDYRKAVQSAASGIRQGEENKRLAKEKEEYKRKKAEEDKKRAEVAEKYDRILKRQEERRKEMNKRFGRPINETTDILEEGAANREAKKINKSIDKTESKLSDFYNGSLTKEEAKEIYKKAMNDCDKYAKQIKEIPNEEFSDKIQNTLKAMFSPGTIFTVGLYAVVSILTGWKSILIGAGLGTLIGSTVVGFNAGGDTKVNGKRSFTKAEVLSKLNTFRLRLTNIYNSFYNN